MLHDVMCPVPLPKDNTKYGGYKHCVYISTRVSSVVQLLVWMMGWCSCKLIVAEMIKNQVAYVCWSWGVELAILVLLHISTATPSKKTWHLIELCCP